MSEQMKNQRAVFDALSPSACLTIQNMVAITGLDRKALCHSCMDLVRNGYIQRKERGCYELTAEGLKVKAGQGVLKKRYDGRKPARQKKTLRVRLWRAMRSLKKFTVSDLLELSARDCSKSEWSNAKCYVLRLVEHGILYELRRGVDASGKKGNGEKRYSLTNDLGLLAPIIKRNKELYDPNTGETWPWNG